MVRSQAERTLQKMDAGAFTLTVMVGCNLL